MGNERRYRRVNSVFWPSRTTKTRKNSGNGDSNGCSINELGAATAAATAAAATTTTAKTTAGAAAAAATARTAEVAAAAAAAAAAAGTTTIFTTIDRCCNDDDSDQDRQGASGRASERSIDSPALPMVGMVEVMDTRREVAEWTPDMELEG